MPKDHAPTPVRGRAIWLGLILILANCYWTVYLEAIWYAWPTDAVPFSTVIVLVFVLSLVNAHLSKYRPALALNYGELITVYVMASLSSAIANWNMLAGAVPVAGHAYWFATPENDWRGLIWRHLPSWLTVSDPAVLRDYYGGDSTFFTLRHMAGWAPPILAWTVFSTALFGSMALLCVLLRKQWTERERLTFPVVQMPLQLMNARSGFFRSRLMWVGFALSATIVIVNAIHFYYPAAPHIPVKRQHIDHLFARKPWSAIAPIKISFYPFMIGLGFLMPLDLCFSAWVFYLLGKAQLVAITAAGVRLSGRYPYFREQSFGAVVAVCVVSVWVGRDHFREALRSVFVTRRADGLARADTGDDHIHIAISGLPDLRTRCLRMNRRVGRIRELLRHEIVIRITLHDLRRTIDRCRHAARTGGQLHLGPERLQNATPFDAHGVRHRQLQSIATCGGHKGQCNPGVPARRLDNGHALLEHATFLGVPDHRRPDATLHRVARIASFDLGPHRGLIPGQPIQLHQRRVPDRHRIVSVDLHTPIPS